MTNDFIDNKLSPNDVQESNYEKVSSETIKSWLTNYLAKLIGIESENIDPEVNFDEYGLDSELAIGLTGDLEIWLGRRINPILLYNYTNIETLSKKLSEEDS